MSRFYYPNELVIDTTLRLPENIVRHVQVLRLKVGDKVILFNGQGSEYIATLTLLEKRVVECYIENQLVVSRESLLAITLVQAISSGDRMDFTLQKSVELGVNEIQPIESSRCVVRLQGERAEKKTQRWQDIVIAACEQSGRAIVPTVKPIVSFAEYIQTVDSQKKLYLLMSLNHSQQLASYTDKVKQYQQIELMIGPEGGWTQQEEESALDSGFQAIHLGSRVLRTETASLAAIAAMQTLWGDFNIVD